MSFKTENEIRQLLDKDVATGAQKPSDKLIDYAALYAAVERLKALDSDEEARAKGVEADLQAAINALNGDAEGSVNAKIKAEEDRAKAAEKANADAIDLLNDAATVEGSVAFAVKAEQTRAEGAEGDLQDAIDAEEAARKAQIGELGKVSDVEGAADHTVKSYVDSKISAVNGDNSALEARVVSVEAIHAKNEDGSFKTVYEEANAEAERVKTELLGTDYSETLSTISAIQSWITESGADAEDGVVTLFESVKNNEAAIAAEITRATAAEEALETYVGKASVPAGTDPEANPAQAATGLTAKVEANDAAIKAEAARASKTESDIVADLTDLATVVGATELGEEVPNVVTRLANLETAVGEGGSVSTQINNAISELNANVTSSDDSAITVTVVEEAGKITSVSVSHAVVSAEEVAAMFA